MSPSNASILSRTGSGLGRSSSGASLNSLALPEHSERSPSPLSGSSSSRRDSSTPRYGQQPRSGNALLDVRHEWDQHLGALPPKPHPIGPARRVGERVLTVYGTGVVVRWHDQEERETAAAAVAAAAAAAAAAVADIVLPAASGAGTGAAGNFDEGASTVAGVVAVSVSTAASSSSSPPSSLSALTDGAAAGSNVSELGGASGDAAAAAAAAATTRMAFGDAVSSGEELAMLDDDGRSPSSSVR